MLKLEPGLVLDLIKKFLKKQMVGILMMLYGFNKISSLFTQTVLALLQAVRQRAVERLWVTT